MTEGGVRIIRRGGRRKEETGLVWKRDGKGIPSTL